MLVKGLKDYVESKAVFPALVSPKLDGVRGKRVKRGLISRRGNMILGMSHITDQLKSFTGKLDGELTIPGKDFEESSGLVRNHEDVPNAVYNVIDIPSFDGTKLKRSYYLRGLLRIIGSKSLRLIPTYKVRNHQEVLFYYHIFLGQGFEGLVYYDPNSLYTNTVNYEWMRMVPLKSEDWLTIKGISVELVQDSN
jgi:ATP-dependent DNA ligase